jgi:hypothetical protein
VDGHFDVGRDRDGIDLKNCGFRTGSVGIGFSQDCLGIFWDVSELQNIVFSLDFAACIYTVGICCPQLCCVCFYTSRLCCNWSLNYSVLVFSLSLFSLSLSIFEKKPAGRQQNTLNGEIVLMLERERERVKKESRAEFRAKTVKKLQKQ